MCESVYVAAHFLSPVQIKPLPTIRCDDKQEDGGARSPDGRLEGLRGTRGGSRAATPVCTITNPGRRRPPLSLQRFDIYTKLTCLGPVSGKASFRSDHILDRMKTELSAPVESMFIMLLFIFFSYNRGHIKGTICTYFSGVHILYNKSLNSG